MLLLKLVSLLEAKQSKLCILVALCLKMFSLKTQNQRHQILLEHSQTNNNISNILKYQKNISESKAYIKIIQTMNILLTQSEYQQKHKQTVEGITIAQEVSSKFLEFVLRNNTSNQNGTPGEVLLPEQLSTANIYSLIDLTDIERWTWKESSQAYWFINLLNKYYESGMLSSVYEAKIIALIGKLLCLKWPKAEYDQIYPMLFSSLASKLEPVNAGATYSTLVKVLNHSLSTDPSCLLLQLFISLGVHEKVLESLPAASTLDRLPWLDFCSSMQKELYKSNFTDEQKVAWSKILTVAEQVNNSTIA
ncbi:uncharacterized protein EV420DRAFT_650086 [Desarmillaria tabescens]|uniref:Uncharacterized protein n=1 Tax=Armillaria tabescens TaxID=1929756 RepID=A0AA39NJI8_ARMTA|nr:uncharacterized protein EV420DRAFT_650086 [Desarmillaria tabescens]KAK0466818.1 hypothetical protein EV420DRAFT_650086 [Desarmillaria tabescens]